MTKYQLTFNSNDLICFNLHILLLLSLLSQCKNWVKTPWITGCLADDRLAGPVCLLLRNKSEAHCSAVKRSRRNICFIRKLRPKRGGFLLGGIDEIYFLIIKL